MPKTGSSPKRKYVRSAPLHPDPDSFEDNGRLMRISPNPLTERGNVFLDLPVKGRLTIELADFAGTEIRTLFEGEYEGGPLTIPFDIGYLRPDTYLCVVDVEGNRYHRMITVSLAR